MTYQGVVMPGWGSDGCSSCGLSGENPGGVEAQLRPFISGAAWYNGSFGDGQTITVRYGCPFSVGTQSGK